jgi:hypothetical protein
MRKMENINIKLNGNIQINAGDDDEDFDDFLKSILDEVKAKLLSIQDKGWVSRKGSDGFTARWVRGEDVVGTVEVNYEKI